jgi:hypothetical protein
MVESFPDKVKSRGSGSIQALAGIGNFITPFLVSFTSNHNLNPVVVVSILLLIGLVPLHFTQ